MDVASPSFLMSFTVVAKYHDWHFIDCYQDHKDYHVSLDNFLIITMLLRLTLQRPK